MAFLTDSYDTAGVGTDSVPTPDNLLWVHSTLLKDHQGMRSELIAVLQEELQSMQARAQYAESRAAVAEAELQSLKKVCCREL